MTKKICVVYDYDGLYSRFWGKLGEIVSEEYFQKNPESVDLVAFTGGDDVSPDIYNHKNLASHNNPARDVREQHFFRLASQHQIPMTGICRGAQFLNVMFGGTMVQDLRKSHGGGQHFCHTAAGEKMVVTSSHHQMIVPPARAKIIAWADTQLEVKDCVYDGELPDWMFDPQTHMVRVTEAYALPENKVFGCQSHPEWQTPKDEAWAWALQMTRKYCFGEE